MRICPNSGLAPAKSASFSKIKLFEVKLKHLWKHKITKSIPFFMQNYDNFTCFKFVAWRSRDNKIIYEKFWISWILYKLRRVAILWPNLWLNPLHFNGISTYPSSKRNQKYGYNSKNKQINRSFLYFSCAPQFLPNLHFKHPLF